MDSRFPYGVPPPPPAAPPHSGSPVAQTTRYQPYQDVYGNNPKPQPQAPQKYSPQVPGQLQTPYQQVSQPFSSSSQTPPVAAQVQGQYQYQSIGHVQAQQQPVMLSSPQNGQIQPVKYNQPPPGSSPQPLYVNHGPNSTPTAPQVGVQPAYQNQRPSSQYYAASPVHQQQQNPPPTTPQNGTTYSPLGYVPNQTAQSQPHVQPNPQQPQYAQANTVQPLPPKPLEYQQASTQASSGQVTLSPSLSTATSNYVYDNQYPNQSMGTIQPGNWAVSSTSNPNLTPYTPIPPSHTPVQNSHSPLQPSQAPLQPSHTPVQPSHTPIPLSHTPVPLSHTPVPLSHTPLPMSHTPVPMSHTPIPMSHTPVPASFTPLPTTHASMTSPPTFTPSATSQQPVQYTSNISPAAISTSFPTQDPISSISSQLGQLSVVSTQDSASGAPCELPAEENSTSESNTNTSLIQTLDGPPLEIVSECPEERLVEYDAYWYRLRENHDFHICTKCHQDHIQNSPFSNQFIRFMQPATSPVRCRFNTPRMLKRLWPAAVRSKSLTHVQDYMTQRVKVPDCKGIAGTSASEGIKWFAPKDGNPEGFIVCEACHEDKILATSFSGYFQPYPLLQRDQETWSCDMSVQFIHRALDSFAQSMSWPSFVDAATDRMKLPACEGEPVEDPSIKWFRPRYKIQNMAICQACYLDRIAFTPFMNEFEEIPSAESSRQENRICKFALVPIIVSWAAAENKKNFMVWWNAANAVSKSPPCVAEGIKGGTWYTLAGGCGTFSVCSACYFGLLEPNIPQQNSGQFFQMAQRDPALTMLCDLHPSARHFQTYLLKLQEALDKSSFSIFGEYVRKFSGVAPCPKMEPRADLRWYGFADCTICPECYFSAIEGTSLAPKMPLQGINDPRPTVCCMYSPRMRGKWVEACRTGSPDELIAFAKYRLQVYNQTTTQVKFITDMMLIRQTQALHHGLLSVQYKGMDSMNSVMDMNDGNRYGNSTIGYHDNQYGAESARQFQMMQQGFGSNTRSDDWMTVARLQAAWNEVE